MEAKANIGLQCHRRPALDCSAIEGPHWTAVPSKARIGLQCHRRKRRKEFYIHGSMRRESNLIIVQQDATYSVYYISVGSSTCFGC